MLLRLVVLSFLLRWRFGKAIVVVAVLVLYNQELVERRRRWAPNGLLAGARRRRPRVLLLQRLVGLGNWSTGSIHDETLCM